MADEDLVEGIRESIAFLRMAAIQLRLIADQSEPEIAWQLRQMADPGFHGRFFGTAPRDTLATGMRDALGRLQQKERSNPADQPP